MTTLDTVSDELELASRSQASLQLQLVSVETSGEVRVVTVTNVRVSKGSE